jgi:thymidylate synthase
MAESYFRGDTLDDVMKMVVEEIQKNGTCIEPSKGPCKELIGVLLEIDNPRARLSRTETKGKPFSCLGELCWYLAKSNKLDFISYYISKYKEYADGNIVYGGYGPRFFKWKCINQIERIITILKCKPNSRKAVIQLFDSKDLCKEHKDVPCTCVMQFMIRDNKLHLITYMRSNDVIKGLPHDVFCFTMIQEIIARSLSIDIGVYKHSVGSIHLYDSDNAEANNFIDEGWQPTNISMTPMPERNPWPEIQLLLSEEKNIRKTGLYTSNLANIDQYWADLIRLLQIFRYLKDKKSKEISNLKNDMSSDIFNSFIDQKLINLTNTVL